MYQAFATSGDGEVTVVARSAEDLLVAPSAFAAEAVYLPGLLNGGIRNHLVSLWRLALLVGDARSVSIVGADTMDGRYGVRPSVRRFRTAAVAARLGAEACVLGFSWNEEPHPETRRALRRTPASVTLFARDPISAQRLRTDGGANVVESADLAFLTEPKPASGRIADWLALQAANSRRIVLVNANPRLAPRFPDQDVEIVRLVDELLGRGFACVVVPHDSRGEENSEVAYLTSLFSGRPPQEALFVADAIYQPPQVAWIASHSELAVSGRMHLVILAAAGGTPALGMDYQGKFEGLYQLLGYDLRISAGKLKDRLLEDVLAALERRVEIDRALVRSLPGLRAKARLNLSPGRADRVAEADVPLTR
jgi:polysaccharide pyruvyl transferase WcaK-like protein